jgi:hypothetical protein
MFISMLSNREIEYTVVYILFFISPSKTKRNEKMRIVYILKILQTILIVFISSFPLHLPYLETLLYFTSKFKPVCRHGDILDDFPSFIL